jgi:hypothetical protein
VRGRRPVPPEAAFALHLADAFSGLVSRFRLYEVLRARVGADVVLTFCNGERASAHGGDAGAVEGLVPRSSAADEGSMRGMGRA